MQHIANLIRKQSTRDRLFEACFADPVGMHLQADFKGFDAKIHKPRWGTVANTVLQLLKVESALRFKWNRVAYGEGHRNQGEGSGHNLVDLDIVDRAITSSMFRASLQLLQLFAKLILKSFDWAEGCRCHSHVDQTHLSTECKKRWASCPMRGRRAPELAAGGFLQHFVDLAAATAAELLARLPQDISAAQRAVLVHDFERGRAHLFFAFSLRLCHWRSAPWFVFGCAHSNMQTARRFTQRCLAMASLHPLIQRLQTQPVKGEAESFVAGIDIEDLPELSIFLGELAFANTAERAIEGDHAAVISKTIVNNVLYCRLGFGARF